MILSPLSNIPFPVIVISGRIVLKFCNVSSACFGIQVFPVFTISCNFDRVVSFAVSSAIRFKVILSMIGVVWRVYSRLLRLSACSISSLLHFLIGVALRDK